MAPITALRSRMSSVLLEMIAGPDGEQVRRRIHTTPGERWFEPGSPVQVVHGDAAMYVGGVRALLLQALHPLAMAAVDDFSDYRTNVWGRLARTATYIATTTFATAEDAQQAVDVVRAVHRHVRGTTLDGRPYTADDPHLLAWVHVAEIDSFLTAFEHFGRRADRGRAADDPTWADGYVEQAGTVALRLGARPEDVPSTRAGLTAAIESYRPELQGTAAARDVARFIHDAPVPTIARLPYRALVRAAVATLPAWAREPLGLPLAPRRDATVHRTTGHAMTAAMRWLTDGEPMRRSVEPTAAAV